MVTSAGVGWGRITEADINMTTLNNVSSLGMVTSPLSVLNVTGVVSVPAGCVLKQGSHVVPWDNKDNLIPKQVEVVVNILFTGIGIPLCFLVSLCCNTMNMAVFWKHGLKERINMLLFTLSLLDLVYVSTVYGYHTDIPYMFIMGRGNEARPAEAFFINNYILGLIGTGAASHVTSSMIALERCLCITRPLLVKNLMSTQKTAIVLWFFLLTLIAGVFVDCMRYTVLCVFDPADNSTFLQFFPSQFYFQNKEVLLVLEGVIYGSTLPASCMTCVFVCTVIIVIKMKKLSSWRETVSSASDSFTARDLTLTRMIVGTSTLFIVCIVPSMVVRVLLILVPDLRFGGRYENLYACLVWTFSITSVINSSFNFFVYYVYGTRFRQTVSQLFSSRCPCKKKEGDKL